MGRRRLVAVAMAAGVVAASLAGVATPAGAAPPTISAQSCSITGEHRVCAYATPTGITVAFAGELPYEHGYPVADVAPVDDQSHGVNVLGSTDGRGYGTTDVALGPGTYSVGLDAIAEGLTGVGGVIRSVTLTVPGDGTAPASYPLPADLTPGDQGLVEAGADGGVFSFGDAGYFGSMGGRALAKPVVGMARTPDGGGYWLVASDGGVFSFGDAGYFGSMGGRVLAKPVVGMARTPDGGGYWLVASDGGVFAFGDAGYLSSMGGTPLAAPVAGMTATPDGGGYWLVASDGGLFAFGDAGFHGSMGGRQLSAPVTGMASSIDGGGYRMVARDGGVFTFGDAPFFGSATDDTSFPVGNQPPEVVVPFSGITTTPSDGYALAFGNGIGYAAYDASSLQDSDAQAFGAMYGPPASPSVGISS